METINWSLQNWLRFNISMSAPLVCCVGGSMIGYCTVEVRRINEYMNTGTAVFCLIRELAFLFDFETEYAS